MITILTTTNRLSEITATINSIDRLDELVTVATSFDENINKDIVVDDTIKLSIDWNDTQIPYIFPALPYSKNNVLALIFYKLGNHQKAFEFVNESEELHQHLLIIANVQYGYAITESQLQFLKNDSKHNLAIVSNFGVLDNNLSKQELQALYENAIKEGTTDAEKIYSVKQYVNLLIDNGLLKDAEVLIKSIFKKATTPAQKNALNALLASSLMGQIVLPYNKELLQEITRLHEGCIAYYEANNLNINAGLIHINASEIANYQDDYIKSKDLINKAILYFRNENIPEFLGEATLQKAILLYNWSKNGSPEYYKPAINTFQNALKVFKRDVYPQKFADIHHNLALIYSEIKVSDQEKPIWTAFCASSFKEALGFYNKEQFPYQYAMVSHNYATALMGFPEAKLHNNLDKAFDLYEEALSIRTPKNYPFERTLTILNQIELYWLIHNENQEDENKKYGEMLAKTNEIFTLVDDETLLEKAKTHLEELKKLKTIIN